MAKVVKRGRGRPRNDGLPPGSKKKTKAKAQVKKKTARAPKASRPAKALAKSGGKKTKIQTDLVTGKYLIAHPTAGVLEKPEMALAPGAEGQAPHQPAVFSREADNHPVSRYAFFDTKEEAELELSSLRRGPNPLNPMDVALGIVEEPVGLPAIDPVLAEAEIVQAKTCFATSYAIGPENDLIRTVSWKDAAKPLKAAVGEVESELKDQLKAHEAALKEFDRRVAEARKDNEVDVRKAQLHLEKFKRTVEVYA